MDIPSKWYNILPDLPKPLSPPRDPRGAEEEFSRIELLLRVLPKKLIWQENTVERWVPIPEDILDIYKEIGRPTPLLRARRLEKLLDTPARIYFKYEGATPTGSHKINTAVPQAYYAKEEGVEGLTTETGAGQWGTALSLAGAMYDMPVKVFMVRSSYEQKPYRKVIMKLYGADVTPSPSEETEFGRKILRENPNHPGSLGIAMSEAIEYALKRNWRYGVGSVMNFVILHQSIIGLEAMKQMEELGEEPDVLVACIGGGSNFGGLVFPFLGQELQRTKDPKKKKRRYIGVTPSEVPKFSKGKYEYDFADAAGLLPQLKMHTLGHAFTPPPIYAGGLRYHGVAPTISLLYEEGWIEIKEYEQRECFEVGRLFARAEGIVPAPETNHAIKAVIDLALDAKKKNEELVILFNFSGHGLLDLGNYQSVLNL